MFCHQQYRICLQSPHATHTVPEQEFPPATDRPIGVSQRNDAKMGMEGDAKETDIDRVFEFVPYPRR